MKQTYQGGYLRRTKRKAGPDRWEYLWREKDESGVVRRRTAIVGTLEQYPNEQAALSAVNGLRMQINADLFRQRHRPILVRDLIDHYVQTDLSIETGWHSVATRKIYKYFLEKWVRPEWEASPIRSVRTLTVEHWLRSLKNEKGDSLADTTKAKIRNIFSR
jgi:integrase